MTTDDSATLPPDWPYGEETPLPPNVDDLGWPSQQERDRAANAIEAWLDLASEFDAVAAKADLSRRQRAIARGEASTARDVALKLVEWLDDHEPVYRHANPAWLSVHTEGD